MQSGNFSRKCCRIIAEHSKIFFFLRFEWELDAFCHRQGQYPRCLRFCNEEILNTETLDDGPIIAQNVIHIRHRDAAGDMEMKGQDLDRILSARTVKFHLENRILVHGSKTIVFE